MDLRIKDRELKLQQKRVKKQLKAQERKRSRILKRMRHLDTDAVMQVLTERVVDVQAPSASNDAQALAAGPAGAAAGLLAAAKLVSKSAALLRSVYQAMKRFKWKV